MMKSKKNFISKFTTVSLLLFITLIYACQTTTSPDPDPDPEPPREPEPVERVGTKEFTLTIVHRGTDEELTGYDIDIDGPVSASESGVSSAQFTLSDVVSGEYTITVSLDGFVNSQATEVLEVPAAESADYFAAATISLRERTPPVTVNNDQETTVTTGKPDEEDAEEEEAISIQIPANSFPPEVVKADGTVDISVTRAKPSQARQDEGETVSESIILSPAAVLNNPVTIRIPIRVTEGLEGLDYVLQPGNIPLTPDGNGNLVATIHPDFSSNDNFGPAARADFEASLTEFREYQVRIPGLELVSLDGFTQYRNIAEGECGAPISYTYPIDGVNIGALPFFGRDYERFRTNRSVGLTIPAVEDRILRAQARNRTRTFTIRYNGSDLLSYTVNLAIVETNEPEQIACHNSGGN